MIRAATNPAGGPGHPLTYAISLTIHFESQAEIDDYWSQLLESGGREIACGRIQDRFVLI